MANTFSKSTMHVIFGTKSSTIPIEVQHELHRYMAGVLRANGCHPRAVGGIHDHVHLVFDFPNTLCTADVVRKVKAVTSKWINDNRRERTFRWQTGYSNYTVSYSGIPTLVAYVENQEEHHKIMSFREEYLAFIKKHDLLFDEKYLFDD